MNILKKLCVTLLTISITISGLPCMVGTVSAMSYGNEKNEDRENVALGKPVDFLQTEGNVESFETSNKNNADKVTDGDESTGGSVLNVWVYDTVVDLGEEYFLDTVNVNMKMLHVKGMGYTTYRQAVCVSSDGINYTEVAMLEDPDMGDTVSNDTFDFTVYKYIATFNATPARYIKIVDKVPEHNGNGYSMLEIEAYAKKQNNHDVTNFGRVAYDAGKVLIDVSRPENVSLPLVIVITDMSGNILYTDTVDITGKRLLIIDIDEEEINVSLGGAINAPNCKIGTIQELMPVAVGEYITFGGYLWQCVLIDENGPLMLCEEVIANKRFGDNSLWQDSDLKKWFDETNVGAMSDINSIACEVEQRQTVTDITCTLLTDGSNRLVFNHYPERMNSEDLYSYYVKDKIFVPDIIQLEKIKKNGKDLGLDEAYWTRTPLESAEYDGFLYSVNKNGNIGIADSKEAIAVRPAFYLDCNKTTVSGGYGMEESPYIISSIEKPYLSISEKGFTETVSAAVEGGNGKLIIVFFDKNMRCVNVETAESDSLTVDVPDGLSVKVLCWDSFEGLFPLTPDIEVINRGEWLQ